MNTITLRLKEQPTVPLEAEAISPDAFVNSSNQDISALRVYHGKRQCRLDDFFEVEGERSEHIEVRGDLHRVRWIGRAMSRGSLSIHGSVGMHLGAYMSGGQIEVHGNASDWVGAEMKRGLIRIHGNVGGQTGAAYRGSMAGMRSGTIIIDGSAGIETGMRMRRGTIAISGPAKDFVGLQMKGGTIILRSGAELRAGAWMVRGTIISLVTLEMLPTFNLACRYNPVFVNHYARHLSSFGIELPYSEVDGHYDRYSGDISVPGKGEILIWNKH